MLVHILFRHVEQNFDDIETTSKNQHVSKEYHFCINNDHTHDIHFVQHCFDKIYNSLKGHGIKFIEYWIWLDGCASHFKYSCSLFWLCLLHKKSTLNIVGISFRLVVEKENMMLQGHV